MQICLGRLEFGVFCPELVDRLRRILNIRQNPHPTLSAWKLLA